MFKELFTEAKKSSEYKKWVKKIKELESDKEALDDEMNDMYSDEGKNIEKDKEYQKVQKKYNKVIEDIKKLVRTGTKADIQKADMMFWAIDNYGKFKGLKDTNV